jgi:flagellar biosynthesis/type III secretory pathway ATPase
VSFTIITKKKENEPNNFISISDTLFDICYGVIFPANDTDYYYISYQLPSNFYLKCHDRLTGFKVIDSSGSIIDEQTGTQEVKQYSISSTAITPLYVCIFSLSDNNSRYELGITN